MVAQRELVGRERREDHRYDVNVDATLRAYRMTPLQAALVDISAGGAMLKAEQTELMIGDEVLMAAGPVEAVATVAWARDTFVGLSFHRRLDSWQVTGIRRAGH